MANPSNKRVIEEEGRPTLPAPFNRWARVYALVIVHLLAWIIFLAWLGERYR